MWLQQLPHGINLHNVVLWIDGDISAVDRITKTAHTWTDVTQGAGKAGATYLDFEGTTANLVATLPTVFDSIATTDHSVACWMNADNLTAGGTFNRVFEAFFDANNFAQFNINNNNAIQYVVEDATTQRRAGSTAVLAVTVDAFIVGTWDASANTLALYVNGVAHAEAGDVSTPGDTKELVLGVRSDEAASTWYNGRISNFMVFDKVLTPAQVGQMYNKHNKA